RALNAARSTQIASACGENALSLFSRQPLFHRGGNQRAIAQQRRSRVMIEAGYAEYVHGSELLSCVVERGTNRRAIQPPAQPRAQVKRIAEKTHAQGKGDKEREVKQHGEQPPLEVTEHLADDLPAFPRGAG